MKTIRIAAGALAALLCSVAAAWGEPPRIEARFEPDSIEVGDMFDYVIDIDKDLVQSLGLPDFESQQGEESAFELVEEFATDTLLVDGRHLRLRKRYRLAAFDTGQVDLLPAITYYDKNIDGDTIYAPDTITLHIASYEDLDTLLFLRADTATMSVKVDSTLVMDKLRRTGVERQKQMPFRFREIQDYVIYGVIALVLLALAVWLGIVLWRRYGRKIGRVLKPLPPLPPHVVANKALEELHNRKLWQNGKYKLYYTSLTTILRQYIVSRFGVSALEMTSDEILAALAGAEDIPAKSMMELSAVLRQADMVKFAKAEPDAEQNEQNYLRAYYFVEETKRVEQTSVEGKQDITIETKIDD